MRFETAAALIELLRAATKHVTGRDPEGPITVTLCGRAADSIEKAYEQTNRNHSNTSVPSLRNRRKKHRLP